MTMISSVAQRLPDPVWTRAIAVAHRRFEPEMGRIVRECERGGTALDVGAWYGPWTYWLSRRVDKVVSFEPNPDVRRVLERSVRKNVTVRGEAASNSTGTATLTLPPGDRGTEGRASLEGLDEAGARTVDVPTCRLDELGFTDVRFMKVDVEGHEIAVLEGATELIERWRPIVVVEVEDRHGSIDGTVELMKSHGYDGRVLIGDTWVPLRHFDLAAHQREQLADREGESYLNIVVKQSGRYINNVVFQHPLAGGG